MKLKSAIVIALLLSVIFFTLIHADNAPSTAPAPEVGSSSETADTDSVFSSFQGDALEDAEAVGAESDECVLTSLLFFLYFVYSKLENCLLFAFRIADCVSFLRLLMKCGWLQIRRCRYFL
jgi:membrane protease YdiL (CAAX protease family)